MQSNLFKLTPEHKKFVQSVQSLCGIKQESIQMLMEYILYTNYLNIVDNPESSIEIPYVGSIKVSEDGTKASIDLTKEFQHTIFQIRKKNVKELNDYYENKWIDGVIDQVIDNWIPKKGKNTCKK